MSKCPIEGMVRCAYEDRECTSQCNAYIDDSDLFNHCMRIEHMVKRSRALEEIRDVLERHERFEQSKRFLDEGE